MRKQGLAGLWEGLAAALAYSSIVGILTGVRGVDWKAEVAKAKGRVGDKDGDRHTPVDE